MVVWGSQTAHADHAPVVHVYDDTNRALENEMHGVGVVALHGVISSLLTLEPLAEENQLLGKRGVTGRVGQPVAQCACLAATDRVRDEDLLLLASLKHTVEVGGNGDIVGNAVPLALSCEIHQQRIVERCDSPLTRGNASASTRRLAETWPGRRAS
jgi:hypothetical protein